MTASNPFDSKTILEGIRQWVEIETPTEAPAQVNRLATLGADGYRDLPSTLESVAGRGGGVHWVAPFWGGQDERGFLVPSHHDPFHPGDFPPPLPFRIEGNSAF